MAGNHIQGQPYLLARYKMAILSKCADDFQKKILENKSLGEVNVNVLWNFQIYLSYLSLYIASSVIRMREWFIEKKNHNYDS